MNEQQLKEEIKKLVKESNIITGYFDGTNFKSDNNIFYNSSVLIKTSQEPGEAFIVKKDDKWLCVKSKNNSLIRTDILSNIRRRKQDETFDYLVKSISVNQLKSRIGLFIKEKIILNNVSNLQVLKSYIANLGKKKYRSSTKYTANRYVFKSNDEEQNITNEIVGSVDTYLGDCLWESSTSSNTRLTINQKDKHYNNFSIQSTPITDSFNRTASENRIIAYVDTWTPENPSSRLSYTNDLDSISYFPDPSFIEQDLRGVVIRTNKNTGLYIDVRRIYVDNAGKAYYFGAGALSNTQTETIFAPSYDQFVTSFSSDPNIKKIGDILFLESHITYDVETTTISKISEDNSSAEVIVQVTCSNFKEVIYKLKTTYIISQDIFDFFSSNYVYTEFTSYGFWEQATERSFDIEEYKNILNNAYLTYRDLLYVDELFGVSYTEKTTLDSNSSLVQIKREYANGTIEESTSFFGGGYARYFRSSIFGGRLFIRYSNFLNNPDGGTNPASFTISPGELTYNSPTESSTSDYLYTSRGTGSWNTLTGTVPPQGTPGGSNIIHTNSRTDNFSYEFFPFKETDPGIIKGRIKDQQFTKRYSGKFLIHKSIFGFITQEVAGTEKTNYNRNTLNDVYNPTTVYQETKNQLVYKYKEKIITLDNSEFLIIYNPTLTTVILNNSSSFILTSISSVTVTNLSLFIGKKCMYSYKEEDIYYLIYGQISNIITSGNNHTINVNITKILKNTKTTFVGKLLLQEGSFYNYFLKGYNYGTGILNKQILKKTYPNISLLHNPFATILNFPSIVPELIHETDSIVNNKIYCVGDIVKDKATIESWTIEENGQVKFNKIFKASIIPTDKTSIVKSYSYYPI